MITNKERQSKISVGANIEGDAEKFPSRAIRSALMPFTLTMFVMVAGAFHNTDLNKKLEEKSIKCLIMTGIAAGGCVFATAIGAMEDGYYPVMVTDCMDQNKISHDFMTGRWPIFSHDEIIATWEKMKGRSEGDGSATAPKESASEQD